MKRKNVFVLLAIALLCVLGMYVIEGAGTKDKPIPPVMPQFERADVTAVSVRGQGDRLELRRRGGRSDAWDVVIGAEFVRADPNAVDDLLAAVGRQSVASKIERKSMTQDDVRGFGLDKPTVEVELTVHGKPVLVRYGKTSREGAKIWIDTGEGTDVWVVPKDAMELAISSITGGMKDKRLFDLGLFDVAKLEIVKSGLTVAQVERDLDQIWHITQPFKGYAHPHAFETVLGQVVNGEIEKWEEFGAVDFVKYGLDKPEFEVRLTGKGEGKKAETILVGRTPAGAAYVMEPGTKTIAIPQSSFVAAIATSPLSYRDRSFTRLGGGGVAIDVQTGKARYKLEKPGSTWDIVLGTTRRPADGARVDKALDKLREWETVDWLDDRKPEDLGIDGRQFIEIERSGAGKERGAKIVLLLGRREGANVYAQRKDDGGAEIVGGGPLEVLEAGPEQFFRSDALDWRTDWVLEVTRNRGYGDEGQKVEEIGVRRDAQDKPWSFSTTGHTGTIDGKALNELLAALHPANTREWLPYEHGKDDPAMGFKAPMGETMTLEVKLNVTGIDDNPKLYIGRHRPQGGYFCRTREDTGWVFVLDDEVVETLKKKLASD